MAEQDLDFYRRRLAEERQREADAATPEARSAHTLLAEIYGERVKDLTFGQQLNQRMAGVSDLWAEMRRSAQAINDTPSGRQSRSG